MKDLATMTIDHRWTVQQVIGQIDPARTQMRFVLAAQKGESVMQEMMKGEHHLCAVIRFSYSRYKVVGLITFEDVIEEVFGDIEDDSDKMWNSRRAGIHKDQETLEWFRQTEWEKRTGLNVNATLKLIQVISNKTGRKWLSDSEREGVVRGRLQGMTLVALADQFNVHKSTIPRIVKHHVHEGNDAHLPVQGRSRVTRAQHEMVID
ncbi:hypothetical protein Y032_0697g1614 [Ancylostoma ceylanicum]|uniref:Uncharacterized protein n=1 Tax=Ancylostoma ceylanicum TaxID=53326 RepID=A0A016WGM5_9BILA|nr:hypothetical protein Y032_0697g1614 [Ancylostoma ceylanicum]